MTKEQSEYVAEVKIKLENERLEMVEKLKTLQMLQQEAWLLTHTQSQQQHHQEQEQDSALLWHLWCQLVEGDTEIEHVLHNVWPLINELVWTVGEVGQETQGLVDSWRAVNAHLKNTHLDLCFVHQDIQRRAAGTHSHTPPNDTHPTSRDSKPPLPRPHHTHRDGSAASARGESTVQSNAGELCDTQLTPRASSMKNFVDGFSGTQILKVSLTLHETYCIN